MKDELQEHVQHIAATINNSDWLNGNTLEDYADQEEMDEQDSAFAYLSDILDIEYIVASDRERLLGARVLVAFGGPNIWINTRTNVVEGYWWADHATASFRPNAELNDALEELWGLGQ